MIQYTEDIISLSGTFKSILNPSNTGEICISISRQELEDKVYKPALKNPVDIKNSERACYALENADISEESTCTVKLNLKSSHASSITNFASSTSSSGSSRGSVLLSSSHGFSSGMNNLSGVSSAGVSSGISADQPNSNDSFTMECRGKICAQNKIRNHSGLQSQSLDSSDFSMEDDANSGDSVMITQYEFILVQKNIVLPSSGNDLLPSSSVQNLPSLFGLTLSKTLISPVEPQTPSKLLDKGIMLSGHFTMLKPYDIGTLRVYLPSASPKCAPKTPSQLTSNVVPEIINSDVAKTPPGPKSSSVNAIKKRSRYISTPSTPISPNNSTDYYATSPNDKNFPNSMIDQTKPRRKSEGTANRGKNGVKHCYGCGSPSHLHSACPHDTLFCYNCNQQGHSSKRCTRKKPWESKEAHDMRHQSSRRSTLSADMSPWNMSGMSESLNNNYASKNNEFLVTGGQEIIGIPKMYMQRNQHQGLGNRPSSMVASSFSLNDGVAGHSGHSGSLYSTHGTIADISYSGHSSMYLPRNNSAYNTGNPILTQGNQLQNQQPPLFGYNGPNNRINSVNAPQGGGSNSGMTFNSPKRHHNSEPYQQHAASKEFRSRAASIMGSPYNSPEFRCGKNLLNDIKELARDTPGNSRLMSGHLGASSSSGRMHRHSISLHTLDDRELRLEDLMPESQTTIESYLNLNANDEE